MPDDAPDPSHVPRKPDWLDEATYSAMQQALYRATAFGQDSHRVAQAVRDVALAHYPAATMRMIAEAVACIVPDPQGPATFTPQTNGERLTPASVDELVSSISYGLKFDERGKPRRSSMEFASTLAAAQIVRQLTMSGYVFYKRPPRKPHTAGSNR